jgi:hypothetical protein
LLALVACGVALVAVLWFSASAKRHRDRDNRRSLEQMELEEKQRAVEETYGPDGRSPDPEKVGRLKERFDEIKARYDRQRRQLGIAEGD